MKQSGALPWYQRTYRWGQTNITEIDPIRYDIEWWREHWRRTRVQGVIINAGGIVAYYPSQYPLHYRAEYLEDRDLFADVMAAAREEGLAVLARMDSNRATEAQSNSAQRRGSHRKSSTTPADHRAPASRVPRGRPLADRA